MSRPLTQSDLIFPEQANSISSTLTSLKRSALSIHNRLLSIQSDAAFVASVSTAYALPLVANERCGSWYIPPARKAESVYFKSTDGHTNEWKFSIRRLNLHILNLVGSHQGCIIVDSTRRGKSMPDALSKTIPIWCCVLNQVLFPGVVKHELHTPPQAVSEYEHTQISKRMDSFVCDFLDTCKPDIEYLRSKVQKPLRPLWVTQKSSLPDEPPSFTSFHPIVLCTASRRVNGAEGSEGGYIQGAADDHEAWSQDLTPALFWNHIQRLLAVNEEDLSALIVQLVAEDTAPDAVPLLVEPTSNLYISSSTNLNTVPFDIVINCGPTPLPEHTSQFSSVSDNRKHIWLKCPPGKLGSRALRDQLQQLRMLEKWLGKEPTSARILVCDPSGNDCAVGVALAILSSYSSALGVLTFQSQDSMDTHLRRKPDKTLIKERLSWITTIHSALNPSRETLKSVNAYLMSDDMARKGLIRQTEA